MGRLTGQRSDPRRRLRELLSETDPVSAPGCYDSLSASLVEAAGFPAVHMSGSGTSASLIGRADVGLLTQTEMIDNARRIAQAVDVPVIADADTGYGPALNVARTVREYEQAGVAGIHLEDQVEPKKCSYVADNRVVGVGEMVGKLRAAAAARNSPDFVLIARTDSLAVEGIDAAIGRAARYLDAGADMLMIESLTKRRDIELVAQRLRTAELVLNWAEMRPPDLSLNEIKQLGFGLVLFPGSTLFAAVGAMTRALQIIHDDGTPRRAMSEFANFDEFLSTVGLAEAQEIEKRFGSG